MKYIALSFILFAMAYPAQAAVTVSEQIMQKGQFTKPACKPDAKDPDYNDCTCDADVRYPQIAGMSDAPTQEKLNDWFKKQAAKTVCDGNKVEQASGSVDKAAMSHMGLSVHYETTFLSPQVLALKFTDWAYTGGAHGNGSVIGVIVDLSEGTILTPANLFSAKNIDAVNEAIYKALSAKSEEEIFHDQVEARKGAFIKDGECQGCTVILAPDGVHVLFQTYEVASFGVGNPDVPIPLKYVSYEAVRRAIEAQKK